MDAVISRFSGCNANDVDDQDTVSSYALVMTATISPPKDAVRRSNPEERLNDYLESLRHYLHVSRSAIDRIVFIENSASDLGLLESLVATEVHDKVVEFIGFDGNDHPREYGKIYGEFRLLDFGLSRTSLISPSERFWKTTGRIQVVNLPRLISRSPQDFDLLCDIRVIKSMSLWKFSFEPWMDLRVYACSVRGYDRLFRGLYKRMKSEMTSKRLRTIVAEAPTDIKVVPRFACQPELRGYSGRSNLPYHTGVQRSRYLIRDTVRRLFPWLWI